MSSRIIEKWEKIGFGISVLVLFAAAMSEVFVNSITTSYPTIVSIITGLSGGLVATIMVLYLERRHKIRELENYYLRYSGHYRRIEMGQDNVSDANLQKRENIGLSISMLYLGEHEFSVEIEYWKSNDAKAIGFLEFSPKDKKSGKGSYRYIKGNGYKGQFGKLEVSWDENNKQMIVFYQHQFPRTRPYNPDNNRGWEVWQKIV